MMLKKRKGRKTTNLRHHYGKYHNLIKNIELKTPNQLWVVILHIETEESVMYLSLITDAYSHKIAGWSLGDTLEAKYPIEMLNMALRSASW